MGVYHLTLSRLFSDYLISDVYYCPLRHLLLEFKTQAQSTYRGHHYESLPSHSTRPCTPLPNATVHCIAVSSCCFKSGRLTVPPRVALVTSGFGDGVSDKWRRLQELRRTNQLLPLLRGGFRAEEMESGEIRRFWGLDEFEKERAKGVCWLGKLKVGLEMYGSEC
jgi:hypothetical protein